MLDLYRDLAEAIAWWRRQGPDSRAGLVQAAVDLLVAGDGHPAVAELAGVSPGESAFAVDALLERVIDEVGLAELLSVDPDILAARRICRSVLAGTTTPRELARWAHAEIGHGTESELMERLVSMDDAYDLAEWNWSGPDVERTVVDLARQIVGQQPEGGR